MGRTALPPTEQQGPDFVGATPADMAEQEAAVNQSLQLATGMAEERDLLNQLLGQAQMADAFAQFSLTVRTSKLAYVKENKLYRALKGKKSPDGQGFLSGTWDEFCLLLGKSSQKIDEDLLNLRVLGEEALESMSRMGIGYRELRQYRKLPEDERVALIEVAKSGDKDALLDIAESLISKHAKEKEALAQQIEELAADKEAIERVAQGKEETINKLQRDVVKLSNPLNVPSWDARVAEFQKEIHDRQTVIDAGLGQHLVALQALDAWLTAEITSQPDYDPEATVTLPESIRVVLLSLDDAVNRCEALVAGMQHELRMKFGADIDAARQYRLQDVA